MRKVKRKIVLTIAACALMCVAMCITGCAAGGALPEYKVMLVTDGGCMTLSEPVVTSKAGGGGRVLS